MALLFWKKEIDMYRRRQKINVCVRRKVLKHSFSLLMDVLFSLKCADVFLVPSKPLADVTDAKFFLFSWKILCPSPTAASINFVLSLFNFRTICTITFLCPSSGLYDYFRCLSLFIWSSSFCGCPQTWWWWLDWDLPVFPQFCFKSVLGFV